MSTDAPADLEVGELLLGQWRLDARIGEGGMGRVFRGTEVKLGRAVAVKALLNGHLDGETTKRFEREAQVMARLDHPNIVTLYGVGRHRGIPFLVMRLLEGASLWSVLDSHGPFIPLAAMGPLGRQLLQALGYIHGQNLLHRDLKPSNIFVGANGRVTLLDLGLARGHQSSLTRTGVVWGTPDYMAPEQIVGEKQLDGRADLYALGVVFYRMLTGKPPFPDNDEQELLRSHLMQPRPDASKLNPLLSPGVGLFLQRAMALRPEDRFQTASDMLQAWETLLVEKREVATKPRPKVSQHEAPTGPMEPLEALEPVSLPKAEVVIAPPKPRTPPPAPVVQAADTVRSLPPVELKMRASAQVSTPAPPLWQQPKVLLVAAVVLVALGVVVGALLK